MQFLPAAIGAGASIIGSIFGGGDKAAKKQQEAAQQAAKIYGQYAEKERGAITEASKQARGDISQYFERGVGYTEPYRTAGAQALEAYKGTLGLPSSANVVDMFHESPGYKFALEQGSKAIQAAGAAKGTALGGGILKELTSYGQGVAEQEYGKFQERLAGLTEFGGRMSSELASETMGTGRGLGELGMTTGEQLARSYADQGKTEAEALLTGARLSAETSAARQQRSSSLISDLAKMGGFLGSQQGLLPSGGGTAGAVGWGTAGAGVGSLLSMLG